MSSTTAPARYGDLDLMPLGGEWRAGSGADTRPDVDPWSGEALLDIRLAARDDLDCASTTLR